MLTLSEINKKINEVIKINDFDYIKELINSCIDDINNITKGYECQIKLDFSESDEYKMPDFINSVKSIWINAFRLNYIDYASFSILKSTKKNCLFNSFEDFYYTKKNLNTLMIFNKLPEHIKNNCYAIVKINYNKMTDDVLDNIPDYLNNIILSGVLAKIFANPKYINQDQLSIYHSQFVNSLTLLNKEN